MYLHKILENLEQNHKSHCYSKLNHNGLRELFSFFLLSGYQDMRSFRPKDNLKTVPQVPNIISLLQIILLLSLTATVTYFETSAKQSWSIERPFLNGDSQYVATSLQAFRKFRLSGNRSLPKASIRILRSRWLQLPTYLICQYHSISFFLTGCGYIVKDSPLMIQMASNFDSGVEHARV